MTTSVRSALALTLVALLSLGAVHAASLPLFTGTPDLISFAAWGAGASKLDKKLKYDDKPSIEVKTKDYFQGAYLLLKSPGDLAPYVADKNNGLVVPRGADPQARSAGGGARDDCRAWFREWSRDGARYGPRPADGSGHGPAPSSYGSADDAGWGTGSAPNDARWPANDARDARHAGDDHGLRRSHRRPLSVSAWS